MTTQPGEIVVTRIDRRLRIDHADPVIRVSASLLRIMHSDPADFPGVTITCSPECPVGDTIAISAINSSLSYQVLRAEPGGLEDVDVVAYIAADKGRCDMTAPPPVPQGAIDAALDEMFNDLIAELHGRGFVPAIDREFFEASIVRALEAAAPAIRADERRRVLATEIPPIPSLVINVNGEITEAGLARIRAALARTEPS